MSDLGGLIWRAVAEYCGEHPDTSYEEIIYAFAKASQDAAAYLLKQRTPTGGELPPREDSH